MCETEACARAEVLTWVVAAAARLRAREIFALNAILIYIANLSHLSREEMRGVPMGPLMYSLAYSVVWSVISAYLIIYYCLKTEVYSRRTKLGIAGLCLIAPWLIA